MNAKLNDKLSAALLCSCLLASPAALASSEKLELSGFGRVVAGFTDDADVSFEGYENELSFQDRRYVTNIDGLPGLVFNGVYNTNVRFRASYTTADFSVNLAEISAFADQLRSFGFAESADSLTMEGEFDIYQVGLALDELEYNLAWEWMKIESDTVLAPNIESYYVQGGLVFQPFTVHLTYADMATNPQSAATDIPLGLAPDLDQLYYAYQTVFARTQAADLESVTLGVRWDAGVRVAFKAEVTHYRGALGISTFEALGDRDAFDERVNLYQVGMEFVF